MLHPYTQGLEPHRDEDEGEANGGGSELLDFDFVMPTDSDASDDDVESNTKGVISDTSTAVPAAVPAAASPCHSSSGNSNGNTSFVPKGGYTAASVAKGGRGFVANAAGFASRAKIDRSLWPQIPKLLLSRSKKAIGDFGMIKDGDRVLLGLSGGKDSLCMLHVLHELQQRAPIHFDLGCVTMDPQFPGFDPSPLIK